MSAGKRTFRFGLIGQTLGILALATSVMLGAATWFVYQRGISSGRAAMLEELRHQAVERTRREQIAFDRIEHQVNHARRLLERRWNSGIAGMQPPPIGIDGCRRLLPTAEEPLALFITAKATGQPQDQQAVATAGHLLRELGPAWCDGLPGMTIAMPERWIAGWGDVQTAMIADLLPTDPIVLVPNTNTISCEQVTWSEAEFEPASGTWSVSARIGVTLDGAGTAIISQILPLDEMLHRSIAFSMTGSETVVFSGTGKVLTSSWTKLPNTAPSVPLSEMTGSAGEALRRLPTTGESSELIKDPQSGLWLGVSRLGRPNWTMVSLLPDALIERQANAQAQSVLMVGLALISSLVILAWALMLQRISLPLRGLIKAAKRLTSGERGINLGSDRHDEIGDLARAFEGMDRAIDLSERGLRATAETLRERNSFHRALVDSAADAVLVIQDGLVIEANPRSAVLFSSTVAALVGSRFSALAPEQQADGALSHRVFSERCISAGQEPQHFAWRAARSDGSEFHAEIGLTQISLPGTIRLLAVIRDVTERNRLEEQLRHSQKMESVGQLAGGVAHDFNNILTAIMGSAQLLLDAKPETPRHKELLDGILTASERAASLIRSLLDFSRKRRPASTPVDVHQILRETIALLERSIDRRITVAAQFDAKRAAVVGDSAQLQNALLNLCLNARDAMPDGGCIRITTAITELDAPSAITLIGSPPPGTYVTITVHDSGSGIDPAILARIFDPFFTTKPIGKGTGLGLAAVYRIVCDHHGGLSVTSGPAQSTSFAVYLPLCGNDALPISAPANELPTHQGTILVVEDETSVRTVAVELLRLLGYRTLEAHDGNDGVVVFKAHHQSIDVVLIDMEMPGLRGSECLREMRAINPAVRAVLCSGFVRDDMESDWRDAGFIALVPKPYRLADLRRGIDFALHSRTPIGEPT